ncbi:helix-turn-helix domain-containing protein [Flexivirga oryzae]|uniref:Transcriptional regulator with XRE-family HTH domain n=1 Tax=Flexivirga oryzae TaxID=1794944 RepID=A0A839MZP9_9MICO|nr:helix-turn-helix transcriptional regulator [Flexivirga oryzae]MBB2890940.1 transcriptional regulator with XRE-family HTH domain [Flexivirga oryzae]
MNLERAAELGTYFKRKRHEARLSTYDVSEKAGVIQSQVVRIENGQIRSPAPDTLQRIAEVLKAPLADVFALAGYPLPKGLPGLRPYMRAKYRTMSPEALDEIEAFVAKLATQHDLSGPASGEDEQ